MAASIVAFPCRPVKETGILDSGDRSNSVRVMLCSGGPGLIEVPELDVPRIAVYVGKPVRMECRHGAQRHYGLAIHGDIDIIPDRIPSSWEVQGTDMALVLRLRRQTLCQIAESSGFKGDIEIRSRFRVRDPQIEHIGWALMAEAQCGYPNDRLYLDCMAMALAAQLLRNHSSAPAVRSWVGRCGMPSRTLR